MMGGALGLAVLASVAASRTDPSRGGGRDALAALVGGYHTAFLVGGAFALLAATLGAVFLRPTATAAEPEPAAAEREPVLAEY